MYARAADGRVSDTREKSAHGRECHGTSEAVAHRSSGHDGKIPKRKPVFFRIGWAQEHDKRSQERHHKPPHQSAGPLLQRPLLVSDASHQKRECNFERKECNRDFCEGVLADSSSLKEE